MRTVKRLHPAFRDDIGDLVTRRPVPGPAIGHVGAFLFLNHHGPQRYPPNNRGLPFGPHPHRGFETVTFILEGELAHTDSAGHASIIRAGGIQWMTAGSGIVHAEVSPADFKRDGGPMEILQLWVNLPARLKMTAPRYVGAQAGAIPAVTADGATVHLISGAFGGAQGVVDSLTGVFLSWVEIEAGGSVTFDGLAGRDVFLYGARGMFHVEGTAVPHFHLAELGPGDGVTITATEPALFLFGHAAPIDEPIVAHGPFVMNSEAEIRQAFHDYQAGKFGVAEIVEA
ncbi:redox-sensitive bicupin YhaK (pirin superfamily) [Sphingomonas kyeonggiensis]|uniref:Redox-sensitive bicupin YhaK (Pirin superfamily) n=1 Tax=Sphingomonas kyeonggiensis TaxID=1268553 RepID=A0A7W7NQA1_9SPHN|nr:pirin family protein [Sphingomonas kyeonggiensis]MBB4837890.1 redox-sensitive bicupin YhaK (pirin superfamily) [Sphingomonas kyeonggiensis]